MVRHTAMHTFGRSVGHLGDADPTSNRGSMRCALTSPPSGRKTLVCRCAGHAALQPQRMLGGDGGGGGGGGGAV
jgi:hypothetical protein